MPCCCHTKDTEGSFVPERVEEIASKVAAEVSANQILSQIQYVRIHSNVEQLALISNLAEHLDAHRNVSLSSPFTTKRPP